MISLLQIVHDTMVDGPGFRTSIYCAGCENQCPGCHNPQSWDIHRGTPTTTEQIMAEIESDPFANVTFTGGDPMFQPEGFRELAAAIRSRTDKTIWCYTGYTFEQLIRNEAQLALLRLWMSSWTVDMLRHFAIPTSRFAEVATSAFWM